MNNDCPLSLNKNPPCLRTEKSKFDVKNLTTERSVWGDSVLVLWFLYEMIYLYV